MRSKRWRRSSLPRCVYWMTVPTVTSFVRPLPWSTCCKGWRGRLLVAILRGGESRMVWSRQRHQVADAVIEARISILNFKGGVGKTSISTNSAHKLAMMGYKVLLIDCDIQANASNLIPQ